MRVLVASLFALLPLSMTCPCLAQQVSGLDFRLWDGLAAQDDGRVKPLDSLARETLRTLANRSSVSDPDTGERLSAAQFYLRILFDWQGWDQPRAGDSDGRGHAARAYFGLHQGDKWDHLPLIRVDEPELRAALGIDKRVAHMAPYDLSQAKIEVPATHETRPFLLWAEELSRNDARERDVFQATALELAQRYWSYQQHRMGQKLQVIPIRHGQEQSWMTLSELAHAQFDDQSDPSGQLRAAQLLWADVRTAYRSGSPAQFHDASVAWLTRLHELAQVNDISVSPAMLYLEVVYNRAVPFRLAWVCMLLACACLLLNRRTRGKWSLVAGWSWYLLGMVAAMAGFAMRTAVAAHVPVTNMYESVIYVGLVVPLFGAALEVVGRRRTALAAAAAVTACILLLADSCPRFLDPCLPPLPPILRGNPWLVAHVLTITASYAALALAWGISNIALGGILWRTHADLLPENLAALTYHAMRAGTLLLAVGTLLGAMGAERAWGRPWGWDPKEVWTLLTLLGYLAILYLYRTQRVHAFGFAVLSVAGFALVVMTWYGVNCVLGIGLHSFGFGAGGTACTLTAAALQLAYVLAASVRFMRTCHAAREAERLGAVAGVDRAGVRVGGVESS